MWITFLCRKGRKLRLRPFSLYLITINKIIPRKYYVEKTEYTDKQKTTLSGGFLKPFFSYEARESQVVYKFISVED